MLLRMFASVCLLSSFLIVRVFVLVILLVFFVSAFISDAS